MQERDTIPQRPTLVLTIASVVGIIVAAIAAHLVLAARLSDIPDRDRESTPRTVPREIAGLEQISAIDDSASLDLGAQRTKLTSYGWVDRAHGIVHVPIEKAMRDLIEQEGR